MEHEKGKLWMDDDDGRLDGDCSSYRNCQKSRQRFAHWISLNYFSSVNRTVSKGVEANAAGSTREKTSDVVRSGAK